MGRFLNPRRPLAPSLRAIRLIENFDLSGFKQFLECGALQGVVGDLAAAGQAEMESLSAGQRDLDRFACFVDDVLYGRTSRALAV